MRVYELAKNLGVDSKMILRVLQHLDIDARNHMSTMDDATTRLVTDIIEGKVPLERKQAPKPKAPKPKATPKLTRPVPPPEPKVVAVGPQRPPRGRRPEEGRGESPRGERTWELAPGAAIRPKLTGDRVPVVGAVPAPRVAPSPTVTPSPGERPSQPPTVESAPRRPVEEQRHAESKAQVAVGPETVQREAGGPEEVFQEAARPDAARKEGEAPAAPAGPAVPAPPAAAPTAPAAGTPAAHQAAPPPQATPTAVGTRESEQPKPTGGTAATEERSPGEPRPAGSPVVRPVVSGWREGVGTPVVSRQTPPFLREAQPSRPERSVPGRGERPGYGGAAPGRYERPYGAGAPGRPARPGAGGGPGRPERPGYGGGPAGRPGPAGPRPGPGGARPGQPGFRPGEAGSRPGARPPAGRPGTRPPGPGKPGAGRPGDRAGWRGAAAAPIAPAKTPARTGKKTLPKRVDDWSHSEEEEGVRRLARYHRPASSKAVARRPVVAKKVTILGPLTVKELAEKLNVPGADVIKKLLSMGVLATINQELDMETAVIVATDFGAEVKEPEVTQEQMLVEDREEVEEPDVARLRPRPPVVTVMGHVDHGKTSLLDAIRHTRVTDQEAGGITQHIGAYTVEWRGRPVVFVDTPGHEAFTAMRARGAKVTDLAVLVVAADDGVMPQTIEAINHARAAKVPIVVAINKIDKADARPDRVKQQLSEHGLIPEEWGGDTVMVPVSARTGENLDRLLEMITLVADIQELKADPDRPARGTIIEAKLDRGRGPVGTVIVAEGTLRVGDPFVAGLTWGKVRAMNDDRGEAVKEAGPSHPVEVIGFTDVPLAGDILRVVPNEQMARSVADQRQMRQRAQDQERARRTGLDELMRQARTGEVQELRLVIKADVQGSLEAIRQALHKLDHPGVRVAILHEGVGAISESDIMLASASGAIVIGFNVRPDVNARRAAEQEGVTIRTHRIIYELVDEVRDAMRGLLKPIYREVGLGRAQVRALFHVPKVGNVAGCYVTEGKVVRGAQVRVVRDGKIIYEGKIDSLRRFKDDVREVAAGMECGVFLERFQDVKEGDELEVYTLEEERPEL